MDSLENQGVLLAASRDATELPRSSKTEMARRIWDAVLEGRVLAKGGQRPARRSRLGCETIVKQGGFY